MGFNKARYLGVDKIGLQKKPNTLSGLSKIFSDYGFLNMWSSENISIDGTTTTLIDYAGEHNLINPSAAAQPTYSASDANFGSKPSFSFDGIDDYFSKAVANWRASDNSGVIINVYNNKGTSATYALSTSDTASNSNWYGFGDVGTKGWALKTGAVHTDGLTAISGSVILANSFDGSSGKLWLNGVDDTSTNPITDWLSSQPTQRDNISIGSVQRSSTIYSNLDWVFSGYMPYTSDQDIIDLQNELKTYYGI